MNFPQIPQIETQIARIMMGWIPAFAGMTDEAGMTNKRGTYK